MCSIYEGAQCVLHITDGSDGEISAITENWFGSVIECASSAKNSEHVNLKLGLEEPPTPQGVRQEISGSCAAVRTAYQSVARRGLLCHKADRGHLNTCGWFANSASSIKVSCYWSLCFIHWTCVYTYFKAVHSVHFYIKGCPVIPQQNAVSIQY